MLTEIVLVRHGQSMGNEKRLFLGHTDLDLTPLGYRQAELTAEALADWHPDVIYSSDLCRAYHTAEAIAKRCGCPVVKDVGLREIYAGLWEGRPFEELDARYHDSYLCFRQNMGLAHPDGGESCMELCRRGMETLDRIVASHRGKRVIVVSHATTLCMICSHILGMPKEEVYRLKLCSNASISTLIHHDGYYQLLSYGATEHLGQSRTLRPPLN